MITEYPVGKNELAVAMTFGECRRLMDSINGSTPIQGFERPQFMRRFNHALAIFQNQELPAEVPEEVSSPAQPNAKDQEIEALKLRVSELTGDLKAMELQYGEMADEVQELEKHREGTETFQLGYAKAIDDLLVFVNDRQDNLTRKGVAVLDMMTDIKKNGFNTPLHPAESAHSLGSDRTHMSRLTQPSSDYVPLNSPTTDADKG